MREAIKGCFAEGCPVCALDFPESLVDFQESLVLNLPALSFHHSGNDLLLLSLAWLLSKHRDEVQSIEVLEISRVCLKGFLDRTADVSK